MSGNQTETLGLTCPEGGDFYICAGRAAEFIGCCASNPCTDSAGGHCPIRNLRPASFDPDRYANIPAQSCDDARGHRVWWTCRDNDPAFLGCCATNPCGDGCPSDHLISAILSQDEDNRLAFVPEDGATSSATTTSSLPTASSGPSDALSSSPGLPTGAIVGIAIGGALALAFVVILVWKYFWRDRRRRSGKDVDPPLHTGLDFSHIRSEDGRGPQTHPGYRHSDLSSTATTIPYSNRSTPTTIEFAKTSNGYHPIQPGSPPPAAAAAAAHGHSHANMPHSPGYTDSENGGLTSGQPSPYYPGHMRSTSGVSGMSGMSYSPAGPGLGQVISEIDGVERSKRSRPGVPEIQIHDAESQRPRTELFIAELAGGGPETVRWLD